MAQRDDLVRVHNWILTAFLSPAMLPTEDDGSLADEDLHHLEAGFRHNAETFNLVADLLARMTEKRAEV